MAPDSPEGHDGTADDVMSLKLADAASKMASLQARAAELEVKADDWLQAGL